MRQRLTTVFTPRFLRFAFSGGVAASLNILSRVALSHFMGYSMAIVISYLIGMTMAYVMMKFLVFEQSGRNPAHEYLRFGLVNLIALAQVWVVSIVLARYVLPWVMPNLASETPAHVIGVLSPIVTSYFLHKHFTFGKVNQTLP